MRIDPNPPCAPLPASGLRLNIKSLLCITRSGHQPGPPQDSASRNSEEAPARPTRTRSGCADLTSIFPHPSAPRLGTLRASRLRRLVLVRASRGAPPTTPKSSLHLWSFDLAASPKTAHISYVPKIGQKRPFWPRSRAKNPTPTGLCEQKNGTWVSFSTFPPPERGVSRRMIPTKPLPALHSRHTRRPPETLIRT